VRIAHERSPKLRYGAGRDSRWLPHLRTLVPQRAFDYLLRRSFGLPKGNRDKNRPET